MTHIFAITPHPTPPPPPPPDNGSGHREVERAIRRAEVAKQKFDQELDGLIEDLHEARAAIRSDPLPGEHEPEA